MKVKDCNKYYGRELTNFKKNYLYISVCMCVCVCVSKDIKESGLRSIILVWDHKKDPCLQHDIRRFIEHMGNTTEGRYTNT